MNSNFFFSLKSIKAQTISAAGSLKSVTSKDVSGFVNISFAQLKLNSQGCLEPIWHTNANKIGYCTEGKACITIRTPREAELFTVEKGDMFFIPQGYIHHIENSGNQECVIQFALDHTEPQTMHLSKTLTSLSENVFNSTFGTKSGFLKGMMQGKSDDQIKKLQNTNGYTNPKTSQYKFDIQDSKKTILTKGGFLQVGTKVNLPVLQGLSILGFGLNVKGIVEPHWHTNAGELVYIVKGKTRITVQSPDGHVDVFEVSGGEGAFAPASYFHNIENIGNEEVEVIAFFSHADPDYIGFGEVIGTFSNDILASVFNTAPNYFEDFKPPKGPLVIVPT